MKREVEYHEVTISFVTTAKEVKRVTVNETGIPTALAQILYGAITGNSTNCLDVEDVRITIDGTLGLSA